MAFIPFPRDGNYFRRLKGADAACAIAPHLPDGIPGKTTRRKPAANEKAGGPKATRSTQGLYKLRLRYALHFPAR